MRYIITIDRASLESNPSNPNVVRVEDTRTGAVTVHREVRMYGRPTVKYGPQRQDGARVWIEADLVQPVEAGDNAPAVDLDNDRVQTALRRARTHLAVAQHHEAQAAAERAKVATLARTWGFDVAALEP